MVGAGSSRCGSAVRGADALAELSGALCTFWAAVYEATESAIFRVSLARRG